MFGVIKTLLEFSHDHSEVFHTLSIFGIHDSIFCFEEQKIIPLILGFISTLFKKIKIKTQPFINFLLLFI